MIFTKTLIGLFLGALGLTTAAPTLEERDVYAPPVLYPHSGTVWYSGQRHNVTWDNSSPPKSISNRAFILLRAGTYETPVVLAHDFDLRKGRVEITVPDVITGTFSVVLFGDSGNWGQDFTINGPISSSEPATCPICTSPTGCPGTCETVSGVAMCNNYCVNGSYAPRPCNVCAGKSSSANCFFDNAGQCQIETF